MARKFFLAALLFLLTFSLYTGVGLLADRAGFFSLENFFYAEKVLLALKGSPPRLENIGLVYPPFPFLLNLLFGGPIAAAGVSGAAVVTLLGMRLAGKHVNLGTKVSIFAFLLLYPPALFLFSQKPGTAVFYALFVASSYFLLRYLETGYTYNIFAFGLAYGLCFLAAYESIVLLPYYLVLMVYFVRLKDPKKFFSLLLVSFLPLFFSVGAWVYLNWIFTGDGWYFLHSPYSYFQATQEVALESLSVSKSIVASLVYTIVQSFPLVGFYYLMLPFLEKKARAVFLSPYFLIYIAPFLLLTVEGYVGLLVPSTYKYSLLGLSAALFIDRVQRQRILKLLPCIILASLAWSWFVIQSSPTAEEEVFGKFLLGKEFVSPIEEYREAAAVLRGVDGKILLDDGQLYPLVVLDGKPSRFILPYNYEFDAAVANPRLFVRCVVVWRNQYKDQVAAAWPQVLQGRLPGFYLKWSGKSILIFERW
ncbi:hypothetical protein [Desulfothermobacter acidiphilus]|uniref:hypothetical protein n=1 Tax=Desulfothermobacter acidiphilus TaxID=1938353 RepID=UPI003F8A9E06